MVKVRNADFERELHLEEERFTVTGKIQGFRKAFLKPLYFRNREPFFPSIPLEGLLYFQLHVQERTA